jgi:hypothetical protein
MKNNNKRASDNRLSTIIPKPGAPSTRKKNTDQQRDSSVESNGSSRSPVRHNPYPNSAGQSSNNNNNIQNNIIDNDGNNNNNTRNNINNNNTQNNINDNDENNNNSNNAQINNKDYQLEIELEPEYSIAELLSLAKEGVFPKKSFNVANRLKKKTQITNFFTSTRVFKEYPRKNVEFICKEKGCKLNEPFNDLSNLNKHFTNKPNDHPFMKKWYELYTKQNASQPKIIPDSTFSLIKFFIASDTALEQFKSPFLRDVLVKDLEMYSVYTFRYKILPAVLKALNERIEQKLNSAEFITIILDGWTGPFSNTEYVAVIAQTITESWDIECMVLGMAELKKGHSAEELKEGVESVINQFKIKNKRKIIAVVADQGKNGLRLFLQIIDGEDISLYEIDNEIEEEIQILPETEYDPNYEKENHDAYLNFNDNTEEGCATVDDEIKSNIDSVNNTEFRNSISYSKDPIIDLNQSSNTNFDFSSMYESMPITDFKINLGTSDLPLFNCANHKLNLATRAAISIHRPLVKILKDLNKINSSIRRSVQLNRAFKEQKCRVRLENLTRWSSSYLMLLSVKKAYDKGLFESFGCPVSLQDIEKYLQILKPVYILSQQYQYNHSSIADVIPSLKQLMNNLSTMIVDEKAQPLCGYLITNILEKFNHELNSSVYKVI